MLFCCYDVIFKDLRSVSPDGAAEGALLKAEDRGTLSGFLCEINLMNRAWKQSLHPDHPPARSEALRVSRLLSVMPSAAQIPAESHTEDVVCVGACLRGCLRAPVSAVCARM